MASRSLFPPSRALPVRMRICFFSAARASFVPPCHDSVPANAEKTAARPDKLRNVLLERDSFMSAFCMPADLPYFFIRPAPAFHALPTCSPDT